MGTILPADPGTGYVPSLADGDQAAYHGAGYGCESYFRGLGGVAERFTSHRWRIPNETAVGPYIRDDLAPLKPSVGDIFPRACRIRGAYPARSPCQNETTSVGRQRRDTVGQWELVDRAVG